MVASAGLWKVQVILPVKSGIPRDSAIMDFHFVKLSGATNDTDINNLRDHITTFFNTIPSGSSSALCSWLGDVFSVSSNAASMRFYSVPASRGALGSPDFTRTWTLGTTGTTTLPEEVALVMSFRGDYGFDVEFASDKTRPRARKRNRVFIGPLSVAAKTQDSTTKRTKPDPSLITIINKSAHDALGVAAAASGFVWVAFSPTLWEDFNVVEVSVDDAFDTQRRRGPRPTARTALAV